MSMYSLKARLLYKFLMKNRALHLFVEGLIRQRPNCQVVDEYKNNRLNVIQLLSYYNHFAFLCWRDTPQGHEFWLKLCFQFYKFIRKNERI